MSHADQAMAAGKRAAAAQRKAVATFHHMAAPGKAAARRAMVMRANQANAEAKTESGRKAEEKRREFIDSLCAATLKPLDCIPCDYSNGARTLLMGRN